MENRKVIGASFSHIHMSNRDVSVDDILKDYSQLGLKHIRLGCYWSKIEKTPGTYDFSEIDSIVNTCGKLGIDVTMTIGMKAPRYPEYYIPSWLSDKIILSNNTFKFENNVFCKSLFLYMTEVVLHFKDNQSIAYWQIENEPLDPSGPHWWRIDAGLLKMEVAIVKNIDSNRPIVINLWGNELKNRNYYRIASDLADIVGLDLYPKVPGKNILGKLIMRGPRDSDSYIRGIIKKIKKEGKAVWISELQAEPWTSLESCSAQQVLANTAWITHWDIDGVFFWGFEYWYQQKKLGNKEYWTAGKKAIELLTAG